MFGVQELATAVQHGIDLVDHRLQQQQLRQRAARPAQVFDGRLIGSDLQQSGLREARRDASASAGHRVANARQLKSALEKALALDRPVAHRGALERGSEASPWEFLHPNA